MANFEAAQLTDLTAVTCPCGQARRGFVGVPDSPVSVHMTEISVDAKVHYHKRLTEIYVVLKGEGHLELDGERLPVKPMLAVMIKPGCRHRAVGRMRLLIVVVPPFDAGDEWFD